MSKNIILFNEEELSFKKKFYLMMDLLIINQSNSGFESFFLMIVFYLQIISSFFSEDLEVFSPKNSITDKILNYIEKIVRIKDLFKNNYNNFKILEIILFILIIILIIHFLISIWFTKNNPSYSYNKRIINLYIKLFIYLGYNIIYDICFGIFCVDSKELNPNFKHINCSKNLLIIIVSIITIIASLILYIFINLYYNDSFYLSISYYSKMSCNYDVFWGINCLIISLLLSQSKGLAKELFLFYNLIISIFFFNYFIKHYLYYNKYINMITGIFHLLYLWTSIFSIVNAYLKYKEKGIIYILTSIIICFFYFNIKDRIEANIFLNIPFYKITNQFYLLYYFRNIYDLVNSIEDSNNDKSLLSGMIKMHKIECPNPNCLLKTKEDMYLPLTNKWNDKYKTEIEDEVFLKNFLIIVMNYFLYSEKCSADMYLNLSLYYLKIIGNYCQAIYYYKKVTELKLTLREKFSLKRLYIQISKALIEKLKPANEQCAELEFLNTSIYFKYEQLSKNFIDEMNNDVNLTLEFWKAFQNPYIETNKKIDFNKVFKIIDKIRVSKIRVENMWNKLFNIYNKTNDFYDLYLDYIEQINNDDLKKRDLESLRKKNDFNNLDNMNNNFYAILFNKKTGIIIANGDIEKEGIIEYSNNQMENILKYKSFELTRMNIDCLMPKIFSKDHSNYIKRYFKIGEKKIIDKSNFNSFAKDKDNSLIKVKLAIKLFPILNDKVYFICLIIKENLDDIIFLDENFNIQGMSMKLLKILNLNNKFLFQDNEIPFYIICRKFVNFYNIFLKGKKKGHTSEKKSKFFDEEVSKEKDEELILDNKNEIKDTEKENIHENIEINENIELEYEIKIPQFLINYSNKLNNNDKSAIQMMSIQSESEEVTDIIEEFDEEELLLEEKRKKEKDLKTPNYINNNVVYKNNLNTPTSTPTPIEDAITPGTNPITDSIDEETDISKKENNIIFNKENEEQKIFISRINQYKYLFEEGKFNELEELINNFNKNSSSIEYKFNFTFDKYIYGNKQISYIVRCIDNKNDIENIQEESGDDLDKGAKYKKEKEESIKPLYELSEEERNEILQLPKIFLNLSIENRKFQKLLLECKNDINTFSKTHGQKKDEILEDENSSQTSQTGFDNGLLKKNKIEEIRSNLMNDISNFYTLQYIKISIFLIGALTFIFSVIYLLDILSLLSNLTNSTNINIYLFQSTLWTTELISIFVTLRVLYQKEVINKYENEFSYNDFLTYRQNLSEYYEYCIKKSLELNSNISKTFGILEMKIQYYLSDEELDNIYWNQVNISYDNENYKKFLNKQSTDSFPMTIAQLLCSSLLYLQSPFFSSLDNNTGFFDNEYNNIKYFEYLTFLIIENGYNNILPNLFNKLMKIPNILKRFNSNQIKIINKLLIIYSILIIILLSIYYFLYYLTNKSIIESIDKVCKIKIEKIEEIIKRIKTFNTNLKIFKEKNIKLEGNKNNSEIFNDNDNKINLNKKNDINNIKIAGRESSLINSNGFNIDYKRYIPYTILKYSFLFITFMLILNIIFLIPIYARLGTMINNINNILIVQTYFFGKLIITSTSTIEIKCLISNCRNYTKLNYTELVNYEQIQDILRGLNFFSELKIFYNEKFLINACSAAFKNQTSEEFKKCSVDLIIQTANNTENLLKLIEDYIFNIEKEYEINLNLNNSNNNLNLFNDTKFMQIEKIFFKFFIGVDENFSSSLLKDLLIFLGNNKEIIIIVLVAFSIFIIIVCFLCRIIMMRNLIKVLTKVAFMIKIVPTSVIITTPELENWIEMNIK